jgi:hypothetical protein
MLPDTLGRDMTAHGCPPRLMRWRATPLMLVVLVAVWLTACASFRSTRGPMKSLYDAHECQAVSETLIVLLPGAYDKPQDFIDEGFVAAVRERKIRADIQMVDAHLGYYNERQILDRLVSEVVRPAMQRGYRRIWFAGISLGGYGTLLYAMKSPEDLAGFFVMAPYLGARDVSVQIEMQGGLENWSSSVQGNTDVDLWRWIQNYSVGKSGLPDAYLGFGSSDRFIQPNGVMAKALLPGHNFVVTGGHDWPTWRRLWRDFLDVAPLPRDESTRGACKAD